MYQQFDSTGSYQSPGSDAHTAGCPELRSLPFDREDFTRLAPDQQHWLLEGFLCAQDVARFRLGQELHDSTGQLVVALRLSLARIKAPGGGGPATAAFFGEIDAIVEQIEKEMRALAFLHCPAQLPDEGLIVALDEFARGFGRRTGLEVSFRNHVRGELGRGSAAAALLRVAQEALTNVYRHAHANSVRISLALQRGRIELCIVDDGQGLPDSAASLRAGVGLRSMRHRVESHGGQLVLERLTRGTRLAARIPADRLAAGAK